MHGSNPGSPTPNPMERFLLWDLAGTLLVYDQVTRRSGPLPGWEKAFPALARDFRMVVATGEESGSANRLLANYDLLPFFEEVFGDLLAYGGKPHGEILAQMGGSPDHSLVIGDRLRGDLPSDCDNLVTLLVNQDGDIATAEAIGAVIRVLQNAAVTMPEAFRAVAERAEPVAEEIGPRSGGMVSAAWTSEEIPGARLWIFEPEWRDARLPIVVI